MIWLIYFMLILVLYLFPSFVAGLTKTKLFGAVVVINIFLGWTFIGWVIALAMAFMGRD